jgi:hypothetical protein
LEVAAIVRTKSRAFQVWRHLCHTPTAEREVKVRQAGEMPGQANVLCEQIISAVIQTVGGWRIKPVPLVVLIDPRA